MTVTTEPKGSTHSYVLADGQWIASCLPEYAEAVKAAIEAASANSGAKESTEEK